MQADKLIFILICLVGILVADQIQQVGRSRGRRALFSKPSDPDEIKYIVRIETFYSADRVTDVDFCTGVLINESIVLTAAHCIYRSEKEKPIGYVVFSNGQMVSGGLYARHANYKNGQSNEPPLHPDFLCSDMALLFLNSPIKIPPTQKKLVIDCGIVYKSGKCSSHGAGLTETGKLSQKILKVPLPNIHLTNSVPFNHRACFETKYAAKERLCQGDSGGPVICPVRDDIYSVIGVSVQVISYDAVKPQQNTTETCRSSFGSIITNTVALRSLVKSLPKDLYNRVKEGVNFENCGSF